MQGVVLQYKCPQLTGRRLPRPSDNGAEFQAINCELVITVC